MYSDCTKEKRENGVCDSECDVLACNYDDLSCARRPLYVSSASGDDDTLTASATEPLATMERAIAIACDSFDHCLDIVLLPGNYGAIGKLRNRHLLVRAATSDEQEAAGVTAGVAAVHATPTAPAAEFVGCNVTMQGIHVVGPTNYALGLAAAEKKLLTAVHSTITLLHCHLRSRATSDYGIAAIRNSELWLNGSEFTGVDVEWRLDDVDWSAACVDCLTYSPTGCMIDCRGRGTPSSGITPPPSMEAPSRHTLTVSHSAWLPRTGASGRGSALGIVVSHVDTNAIVEVRVASSTFDRLQHAGAVGGTWSITSSESPSVAIHAQGVDVAMHDNGLGVSNGGGLRVHAAAAGSTSVELCDVDMTRNTAEGTGVLVHCAVSTSLTCSYPASRWRCTGCGSHKRQQCDGDDVPL